MAFIAYDLSLDLVSLVAPVALAVQRHDRSLADQMRRAVASVPANLAEGSGRVGRDRVHHYRIALGSAKELRAHLDIAGRLAYADTAVADRLADRVTGLVYGLTR